MKYNKFQMNPVPNVNKNANLPPPELFKAVPNINSPIPSHLLSPPLYPLCYLEGNFVKPGAAESGFRGEMY